MDIPKEDTKTIYTPDKRTKYSFMKLPKRTKERFRILAKKELDIADVAAQAAVELNQTPEIAAKRSYRLGILRMQGLYEILPTLTVHPAERLSYLAQNVIDELNEGVWDHELSKHEIRKSKDALMTIRSLLMLSFREYPEDTTTDLIQEAFRMADTVEEDVFLGTACVHRACVPCSCYYFPDVDIIHPTS